MKHFLVLFFSAATVFGETVRLGDLNFDSAKQVSVDMAGVCELKLAVTDADGGKECDDANWAEPSLSGKLSHPVLSAKLPAKYSVEAAGLTIQLDAQGGIVGSSLAALAGQTRLGGDWTVKSVEVKKLAGGGYEFTRMVTDKQNHQARITDRFLPAKNSVRWEVEVSGEGDPWTTAIETCLHYPATEASRFWSAWSDPEHRNDGWRDPRVLLPFPNRNWAYSNLDRLEPENGNFISAPLITVAEPATDKGLSLVLSPEDHILTMRLASTRDGTLRFIRQKHRLGRGTPARFAMDLVPHEADWRGGLRFMTERYPQFFNPPSPKADAMAGCGAYSGDERSFDAAPLRKMSFRFNWKLSDDFAYMGMFIPPVTNADESWERSCDEQAPPGKGRTISCRQLNDYARRMKADGFFVLNYFNVTEFGKKMGEAAVRKPGDPELWKDPRAFLKYELPNATVVGGDATCYGATLTDPGDPAYQKFILEQADRHIKFLPDTDGVCIDRTDWLMFDNPHADDGLSWVAGKPVRALAESWKSLMRQFGPKMRAAGKVVFSNPKTMRLDLMQEVDGFYCEHSEAGPGLNSMAWISLRKSAITWTDLKAHAPYAFYPDPDSFMQRHLLMGIYPTAPYPGNNHALPPHPTHDRLYLDYGPLMDAMRGKKWVLAAHCVESDAAKVNLFEVPGGYSLPVTFAGKSESVTVRVRNVPGMENATCEAIHPGIGKPVPLTAKFKDGTLELTVPVMRGCAMVTVNPMAHGGSGS